MGYVLLMNIWSVGQGVKTPPFHGGNTRMTVNHDVVGSSPTGGASIAPIWVFFYFEKARIIAILAFYL